MGSLGVLLGAFLTAAIIPTVSSKTGLNATYGETITIPCNNGDNQPADLVFTKWKYTTKDGVSEDLLVKQSQKDEAKITAPDSYRARISISADSSLLIQSGTLQDENVFTCIVVTVANLKEYPVDVYVHKRPSAPEFRNKARRLEDGKLMPLGECVALNANPPAEITWVKNNKTLVADDKTIVIKTSVTKDPVSSLSTTTSGLQYMAGKQDMTSKFACVVKHVTGSDQVSAPESFSIHYPTENMSLQVLSAAHIREGDDVTLKCQADGNPPPTSFNFHFKGKTVSVTDSDVYTLTNVSRADSGEYKCSLLNNDNMGASATVTVTYLDLSLSPSGKVLKKFGESLEVKLEKNASSEATVSWTKDNGKLDKLPHFSPLTYKHAGLYTCAASADGIERTAFFDLVVEGTPVIKSLTKESSKDGKKKVLVCVAEGAPEPEVQWSVNGTHNKVPYAGGFTTYKLTIVPSTNLTVTCTVSNKLGVNSRDIDVSSDNEGDKAAVIVGVVVGLVVLAALGGIVYCLYMRRRQGTWKTAEKELGNSEESKKLEENNHRP
ncbi:CD166 antigen homolog A isoform X2 [Trichomycterus rosablanca]|uniref:CD166 antigen homolog A isoform X2 n=1 Tax=Trichomycterus rosablanca TaxID=2290929 RepID=UPI002F35E628